MTRLTLLEAPIYDGCLLFTGVRLEISVGRLSETSSAVISGDSKSRLKAGKLANRLSCDFIASLDRLLRNGTQYEILSSVVAFVVAFVVPFVVAFVVARRSSLHDVVRSCLKS